MFIYKYNNFTKKYYKYKINKNININDPMFDNNLHNNNINPIIYHKTTCAYCNTCFASRNKLYYHLAFMDINIVNNCNMELDNYDSDIGSYGYEMNLKKKYKKLKKTRIWLKKQKLKKLKKYQINAITELFLNKLNL